MATLLLKARLALELPRINKALERATQALPVSVRPVAEHIFQSGGKRLRPFLTVIVARALGYTGTEIYDLAITLEMLHAATLLHDDILDNADTRRGQAAAHTLFNPAQVILTGDALLALANDLVAAFHSEALIRCFSDAIVQTCAGEIQEIASQHNNALTTEEYLSIIRGKTAWLIRSACEMAALLANATEQNRIACSTYGENVGMAFQLVDDALDYAQNTGKPLGGDLREGKMTPPLYYYRQSLTLEARQSFDQSFCAGSFTAQECENIAKSICQNGFDQQTRLDADKHLNLAVNALNSLPETTEKMLLRRMAEYVRNRKK